MTLTRTQPVSAIKLSDQVYHGLFEAIMHGAYPVGQKLPTESALATQFGVSRPTVREALAQLRDDGIIASRRGSGSFVIKVPAAAVLQFAPIGSIADMQRCFEFRIGLEGEIAFLAASRAEGADLSPLHKAFADLEDANKRDNVGTDADLTFHSAIADLSDNHFYRQVFASLVDNIAAGMNVTRSLTRQRPFASKAQVQQEHAAIIHAIERNNGDGARLAMRTHLENAKRRVFEGTDSAALLSK